MLWMVGKSIIGGIWKRVNKFIKCAFFDSEKSRFIKEQEASGLLSSLGIRSSFSQIPLVCHLYFKDVKQVK